jgi:hypothetical protein
MGNSSRSTWGGQFFSKAQLDRCGQDKMKIEKFESKLSNHNFGYFTRTNFKAGIRKNLRKHSQYLV